MWKRRSAPYDARKLARTFRCTPNHVNEALRRPVYAGWQYASGETGELVRGTWPAIIPLEQWRDVCAILSGKPQSARTSEDFPLRGIVICPSCGKLLTAAFSKGRNGTRYGYYRCKQCGHRVPAAKAETALRDFLLVAIPRCRPLIEETKKQIAEVVAEKEAMRNAERLRHEADLARAQAKKKRLLDTLAFGTIDQDSYIAGVSGIENDIIAARAAVEEEAAPDPDLPSAIIEGATALLVDLPRLRETGTPTMRQRLIVAFFGPGFPPKKSIRNRSKHHFVQYFRAFSASSPRQNKNGAPGRSRTCNLLIRSQMLYPIELQARRTGSLILPPPADCNFFFRFFAKPESLANFRP